MAEPGLIPLDAADMAAAGPRPGAAAECRLLPGRLHLGRRLRDRPREGPGANLSQPLDIARAISEIGGRFVYFSTDYVFDGTSGPYAEDDPVAPLSDYGQAKFDAEAQLHQELGQPLLIARTAWVYGPERQGKNFAYQVVRALKAGQDVRPLRPDLQPQLRPRRRTRRDHAGRVPPAGLFHVVGPEVVDRVAFGRAIADAFELDASRITAFPPPTWGRRPPDPPTAASSPPGSTPSSPASCAAWTPPSTTSRDGSTPTKAGPTPVTEQGLPLTE